MPILHHRGVPAFGDLASLTELRDAGARELIDMGVYPFVVSFRPHPGSLAVDVDHACAPRGDVVEDVTRRVAKELVAARMVGADQKGCAACGACSVLQNVGG